MQPSARLQNKIAIVVGGGQQPGVSVIIKEYK